jgi:hypothetical protein
MSEFLDFVSYKVLETSDGFIRANARIARVGIQQYQTQDGSKINILRPEDAVVESVDKMKLLPITAGHVDMTENVDSELIGSTGATHKYVDGFIVSDIAIYHSGAVKAIDSGSVRQFSVGYRAEVTNESGVWVDEHNVMDGGAGTSYPYDAIMTNIQPHHLALVEQARAGNKATFVDSQSSLWLDGGINIPESKLIENDNKDIEKVIIIHDGINYNIEGSDADKLGKVITSLEQDNAKLNDDNTKLVQESIQLADAKDKEIESLKGKITELESNNLDAAIGDAVESRIALWTKISDSSVDVTVDYKLNETQIKQAYLAAKYPHLTAKVSDASDAYIEALWDASDISLPVEAKQEVKEEAKEEVPSKVKEIVTDSVNDSRADGFQAARDAYIKSRSN